MAGDIGRLTGFCFFAIYARDVTAYTVERATLKALDMVRELPYPNLDQIKSTNDR